MQRLLYLILLFSTAAVAQEKFWIFFNDKQTEGFNCSNTVSAETVYQRKLHHLPLYQWTDIPVSGQYVNALSTHGIAITNKSKWLNGVTALLTPKQVAQVADLPFVKEVTAVTGNLITTGLYTNVESQSVYLALEQIKSKFLLQAGLTGKNVKIGVMDAGFHRAHTDEYLQHLFSEFKILGQRDFVNPTRKDLIVEQTSDSDGHGRRVLDMITGYNTDNKSQMGMAVNSQFYLARTENGASESRAEEDTWIAALEWMDSLGVRLVSTSLGYSINMDNPSDNYHQEEMNGKTARITKAAQIATEEKGIFVVVSAGNEGGNPSWRIISAPADAQGVLSVGATNDAVWNKIFYSSIGPEALPYLKPNVSCYSPDGTSFSAPNISGFVACLMEKAPELTNKQLKEIVEKSGHLYPYGNNYIGYGIPQADRALALIANPQAVVNFATEKEVTGKKYRLRVDKSIAGPIVVFNKKNERIVVNQSTASIWKGKIKLDRKPNIARSTVVMGKNVLEIIWK